MKGVRHFAHVGGYPLPTSLDVLVLMTFARSDFQSCHLHIFHFVSLQGLTIKIGNVKRMSPASKAGLSKMDYLISVILDTVNENDFFSSREIFQAVFR